MGASLGRFLKFKYSDISLKLEEYLRKKEDLSGKTADLFYLSSLEVLYSQCLDPELLSIIKIMHDTQCDIFIQEKR